MANRRERRWQLRVTQMLKIKNMYGPFSEIGRLWYNKTMTEGRALFERNKERMEQSIYEQLSEKEANLKVHYTSLGYSEAKIEKMLEAWRIGVVKNKETLREDRKAAKALLREAAEMK